MTENGLSLSKRFFQASLPLLNRHIPDVMARSAAGLVGEGSECLGVDDHISRDHDWGAAFPRRSGNESYHSCSNGIPEQAHR